MSTLEQRLTSLVQAIGADIKAHAVAIAAFSSSGASVKTATIDVPYGTKFTYVTTLVDASVHLNSIVLVSFGATPELSENDAEELSELSLVVNPSEGALEITLSSLGPIGGPIPINYMIGA